MPLDGIDSGGLGAGGGLGARVARFARQWAARRGTYQAVFGTPQGTVVLRDLFRQAGLDGLSIDPRQPDSTHTTAFNEGKKFMALHIADMLRLTPARIQELAERDAQVTAEDGEN